MVKKKYLNRTITVLLLFFIFIFPRVGNSAGVTETAAPTPPAENSSASSAAKDSLAFPTVENGPASSIAGNSSVTSPAENNSVAPAAAADHTAKNGSTASTADTAHPNDKNGPISLDLRGVEISQLFKVLSTRLGINIIPSKGVTGRVNLFLNNIPPDQILDIIMISQGLAYEKRGNNVIIVMTEGEYESIYGKKFDDKKCSVTLKAKYTQPKLIYNALMSIKSSVGNIVLDEKSGTLILIDIPQKLREMEKVFKSLDKPPVTEVFELQYAKVEDIKDDVNALVSKGTGIVIADERTNSLIVKDLPGNMKKISQAIRMLDTETREVLIEAEIVEVTLQDDFKAGVEWEKIMNNPSVYGTKLFGAFAATDTLTNYLRLTMGGIANKHQFEVTMDFLNTLGNTRILSRPRIACTNNQEATIHVGTRDAIITGTTSQSTDSTITSDSVEFIDTGIKLVVVPTINRDGFVTMKIKPEVSSVQSYVTTGSSTEPRSRIPIVTTSEAETTVKVKDGSMIMIAGLRKTDNRKTVNGIPFLSELPVIGGAFGNRDSQRGVSEIIIFLTPHIIQGDNMMSWDINKLQEYPPFVHPKNKSYLPPDTSILKKLKKPEEVDLGSNG